MAICRFWESGTCKFGANCRNEHPGSDRPSGFSRPKNAFEVLNRGQPGSGQYRDPGSNKFGEAVPANTYNLNEATIRTDLTTDLPIHIFSCYGPGKDAPLQLFGGEPRERSYEEWRLRYYELAAQGRVAEAQGEEDAARAAAEQQIQAVLNDLPGAIRYINEGANKHPNRIDVIEGRARSENETGFGANEIKSGAGGFGPMQSTPNAANPFANSASANPFAKPAQPAFGAPSLPGSNSPFGNPQPQQSVPGPFDPGAPQNPFNRAAPGNAPAFQQPTTTTASPFANSFGKPAAPNNPFANTRAAQGQTSSPFGTSANAAATANPFGKPAPAANPFASPGNAQAQAASPFGSAQVPAASPFARNESSQAPPANPFATSGAGQNQPANPFATGGNSQAAPAAHQSNPFDRRGANNNTDGLSLFNHAIPNNEAGIREFDNNNPPRLRRFRQLPLDVPQEVETVYKKGVNYKGQEAIVGSEEVSKPAYDKPFYLDAQGRKNRVFNIQEKNWNGRPAEEPPESAYTPALREGLEFMLRNGMFKNGVMPELPLPRADTPFDI